MFHSGRVEAALRINHVRAGHLVKADGDLMASAVQFTAASGAKKPRLEETRTGRQGDGMVL